MISRKLGTVDNPYDVLVGGQGISGSSTVHHLVEYTDIKHIGIIEKEKIGGLHSSNKRNNSQTLHYGDIETNYTPDKTAKVQPKAELLEIFVRKKEKEGVTGLYEKVGKMSLGVGAENVAMLQQRYQDLRNLFPNNVLLNGDQIAKLEPAIMEGRDPNEPIIAYFSPDGYTVDFGEVGNIMLSQAKKTVEEEIAQGKDRVLDVLMQTEIDDVIERDDGIFEVRFIDGKILYTRSFVSCMAGGSAVLAKKFGHLDDKTVMSVAGNFYKYTAKLLKKKDGSEYFDGLNNKVYLPQDPELPYANLHGDPMIGEDGITRVGPTAFIIPTLEREHQNQLSKYIKDMGKFMYVLGVSYSTVKALGNIITKPKFAKFMFNNLMFMAPFGVGKRRFVNSMKTIIPNTEPSRLKYEHGDGATRSQIVDTKTGEIMLGEARFVGTQNSIKARIIMNITPSPGATTAVFNGNQDAKQLVEMFEGEFNYDKEKFDNYYSKEGL